MKKEQPTRSEWVKKPDDSALSDACFNVCCDRCDQADCRHYCHSTPYKNAQELIALRAELEQVRRERDAALDNADFWGRELNNFRRNAAHRAEQLAKEKVEAAEQSRERMREALEKSLGKNPGCYDHKGRNRCWYCNGPFVADAYVHDSDCSWVGARKALEGER